MARDTNADGITYEEINAAYEVLETLREHYDHNDMNTLKNQVNETHYLVQLYEERSTFVRSYDTPTVGGIVRDTESPNWSESDRVVVTDISSRPASREYITIDGKQTTVSAENRGHPSDAPVVYGEYINGDKEYAFPSTRLDW